MTILVPHPHQQEACDKAVAALRDADRTTVVMPCGTGKSLVGQLVDSALAGRATLLLFPSIALIQQTLVFWREMGMLQGANCLCVCSDQTVGNTDDVVVTEDDLGMHITTAPEEVQAFFARAGRRIVVFSTYHSTPVLGDGLPTGFAFDVGIFDEAHRTASSCDSAFSFALSDANLPIAKRLFMTATPRHDVSGEAAFSMDNAAVYGERSYVLPFREAIEKNLICDYKILVSIVTSTEVAAYLSYKNGKIAGGKNVKLVAAAIAIKKAMAQTGARKVFAFHGTVAEAEMFSAMSPVKRELGCETLHVSGQMAMSKRYQIVDQFKDADQAVLTNARCLTEGIDVPSVDMIAFIDPKRSIVDIVQAIGRGLRRSPGKEFGYILLPVYIDVEKANGAVSAQQLSESQMKHIWSVLANMAEQEAMVALTNSSTKADIRNARRTRVPFKLLGAPSIVSSLRDEIDIYYANRSLYGFEENYAKLLAFKERTGSANPTSSQDNKLAVWCRHLRYMKSTESLSAEKIGLLDDIGFAWNGRDPLWMAKLENLKAGEKNYRWEAEQRKRFREKLLDPERVELLKQAGFDFEPMLRKKAEPVAPETKSYFDQSWDEAMRRDGNICGQIQVFMRASGLLPTPMTHDIAYVIEEGMDAGRCKKLVKILKDMEIRLGNTKPQWSADIAYLLRVQLLMLTESTYLTPVSGLTGLSDHRAEVSIIKGELLPIDQFVDRRSMTVLKKDLRSMMKDGAVFVPFNSTPHDLWMFAVNCVCCQVASKTTALIRSSHVTKHVAVAEELRLSVELANGNVLCIV